MSLEAFDIYGLTARDQAQFAAAKLVDHPEIANVYVIHDMPNDHAYLILQAKSTIGHYWIYDPWLYPDKIMEDDAYTAAVVPRYFPKPLCREIFQKVSSDTLYRGDFVMSFDEIMHTLLSRAKISNLHVPTKAEPVTSMAGDLTDLTDSQKARFEFCKSDGGGYYVLRCKESDRHLVEKAVRERVSLAFGDHGTVTAKQATDAEVLSVTTPGG